MTGHLAFYREHNIAPVAYHGDARAHFERRASLYRSLRLPPLAFKGARVLEVACGTGQNAAYVASLAPRELVLVEPNAVHVRWGRPHLVPSRLEDYTPPQPFDIVICENWLGLPELPLLPKLAGMVSAGGVLVITCVHPLGMGPNMLRRALARRLVGADDGISFEEKTKVLVHAFETHLATMPDMTRSAVDWVRDWLLNPAIEHIGLTFPMLIEQLGAQFTVLGSSPEFGADWRWFKSLHGAQRRFNEHALERYAEAESFFVDHTGEVDHGAAIAEAEALLAQPVISTEDVRTMKLFVRLFGRETIYCSFQKND